MALNVCTLCHRSDRPANLSPYGQDRVIFSCGHHFHPECIRISFLEAGWGGDECPMCSEPVVGGLLMVFRMHECRGVRTWCQNKYCPCRMSQTTGMYVIIGTGRSVCLRCSFCAQLLKGTRIRVVDMCPHHDVLEDQEGAFVVDSSHVPMHSNSQNHR
jgi:hypothetical protein